MTILVTADPELPVPPRLYGGIERVIALLVEGLSRHGHQVALIANGESSVSCELIPYRSSSGSRQADAARCAALIARETRRLKPDVVQSFSRLASLGAILPSRVRKVMSYQRAVTPRTVRWARRLAGDSLTFTGCSRALIEPVASLGDWRVVYNAVPLERYTPVAVVADDAPLVFLGRVERIKGTHLAIDIARRTGRRLVIAGNVPEAAEHQEYFRDAITPYLDGRRITYAGPVDDGAKNELLGSAAALLMPILWDEPFGIVMAEALACGTPVIGLARGSVPEVVEHGVTGSVCADSDAMCAAVERVASFDRRFCREAAERRFSQAALVQAYESIYRQETPA